MALLSIGVASAEESSINVTVDDSSTEVLTSSPVENTSLDVVSKDNTVISQEDVKYNNDDTTFSNNKLISSSESTAQKNILAGEETPKTFTELQEEITVASGTLILDSNYKMVSGESKITISKDITIDGKGFTIDANKLGSIFKISRGTVSLINITLANSIDSAIYVGSSVSGLSVSGCSFVNNFASRYGGAIYDGGSGSIVSGCSFVNNSASSSGGAIYTYSGSHGLSVSGCSFVNNFASRYGGAIYNGGSGLSVINSTFVNNSASSSGGVIYDDGSGLSVINSTFVNNFAFIGGAIFNGVFGSIVSGCTFVNNSASFGGTIYNEASGLSVINSTFVNNSASSYGGAIYNCGSGSTGGGCTFVNNSVQYYGGAIYNDGSDFSVSNSEFKDNDAIEGTAIYNSRGGNYKATINLNNNIYSGVSAGKTYIYNDGTILTPAIITVLGNKTVKADPGKTILNAVMVVDGVSVAGGLLKFLIDGAEYGEATSNDDGTYTLNYVTYFDESKVVSASYGGADNVFVKNATLNCVIETFTGLQNAINTASVISLTSDVKMQDVENITFENGITISKDITINGNGFTIDANKLGRIFDIVNEVTVILINITLANSIDSAFYVGSSVSGLTVCGCSFVNNSASSGGGAISNFGSGSTVCGCSFVNNSAGFGGVIYNGGSGLSVINSTFVNNSAQYYGGVIWNSGSGLSVINSTFVNNSASSYGGAIINKGLDFSVSNSEFKDNNAIKGTAIYNDINGNYKATINNTYSGISEGKTYIYNKGTILTPLTISVLENKTIKTKKGESVVLFATITTNDGASVAGGTLNFIIDQSRIIATSNDNGTYDYNYTVPFENTCKVVGANYWGYSGNGSVLTGILDAKFVDLTANDVTMIYKDGSRLYATLLDVMGNPIVNATLLFKINGATYNRATDGNGVASIALNLEAGNYTASISYFGNRTANVSANVAIKSTIGANDLVKLYQNGTQFYAKFLNSNGKALANTDVKFNINGVFYTRATGNDGVAKLSINLNPGKYILTAINPINGEQSGYNVVVKSLVEANDLTKYYKNESKFESKIYNKDGSLAINKEVKFNINGVFYTRTTDENGIARLGINLIPGNYVITTIVDGLSRGNNVCVLPTVLANDLNMNFQDGSKFSTTILNGQGVPLSNQNVTFNVNGVFYNRISNGDGVASLTINLLRGEYIITSMWNDYQVGNKITIS